MVSFPCFPQQWECCFEGVAFRVNCGWNFDLPGAPWLSGGPEHKPLQIPQSTGSTLTLELVSASRQILQDTGVFEHTWRELELWLEHLDSTQEEERETVIQFLERVSTYFLCEGACSG